MNASPGPGQLIAGAAGVLLIVSLFLPWVGAGSIDRTGWELWTMADVFLLIVGLLAIGTAITGGHVGLFRPDLSLRGATDLLGIVATILVAGLLLFDFPEGADREIGVYVALISAIAVAGGVGDYSVLRGAPLFPRPQAAEDRSAHPYRASASGAERQRAQDRI
jgi:hypothetical protein